MLSFFLTLMYCGIMLCALRSTLCTLRISAMHTAHRAVRIAHHAVRIAHNAARISRNAVRIAHTAACIVHIRCAHLTNVPPQPNTPADPMSHTGHASIHTVVHTM